MPSTSAAVLDEATLLSVVRNKILVDVQGGDVLLQIFTQPVLQRQSGQEAPFLEFIQRVCGKINNESAPDSSGLATMPATVTQIEARGSGFPPAYRAGCGGFGIRNFLTLFLSIEVSKASQDETAARQCGDVAMAAFHARRIELFTEQLVEANPILNEISECMSLEGKEVLAQQQAAFLSDQTRIIEVEDASFGTPILMALRSRKTAANEALRTCSAKYNKKMREHRENIQI